MAESRKRITERDVYTVWAAAAGRCMLCGESVISSTDLGVPVPIGELAHNVGATSDTGSPRGQSDLSLDDRALAENLLLLCRNCHKPVDDGGQLALFSVEELARRKRDFEQKVFDLTALVAAPPAVVLRIVGTIRDFHPELTPRTVQLATVRSGYFPRGLEGRFGREIELDLRELGEMTPAHFVEAAERISRRVGEVNDAVRKGAVDRVALFAFARIPLLIHLGATLSDKAEVLIFDRHRNASEDERWVWPESDSPPTLEFRKLRAGAQDNVTVLVNLSGTVDPTHLPEAIAAGDIYVIRPDTLVAPGPGVIGSRIALRAFEQVFVDALAELERSHPNIDHLNLAGAIPLSAAVAIGRNLKPDVTPPLRVFDRNETTREFFLALEVRS